jgi:hypothetical protein
MLCSLGRHRKYCIAQKRNRWWWKNKKKYPSTKLNSLNLLESSDITIRSNRYSTVDRGYRLSNNKLVVHHSSIRDCWWKHGRSYQRVSVYYQFAPSFFSNATIALNWKPWSRTARLKHRPNGVVLIDRAQYYIAHLVHRIIRSLIRCVWSTIKLFRVHAKRLDMKSLNFFMVFLANESLLYHHNHNPNWSKVQWRWSVCKW